MVAKIPDYMLSLFPYSMVYDYFKCSIACLIYQADTLDQLELCNKFMIPMKDTSITDKSLVVLKSDLKAFFIKASITQVNYKFKAESGLVFKASDKKQKIQQIFLEIEGFYYKEVRITQRSVLRLGDFKNTSGWKSADLAKNLAVVSTKFKFYSYNIFTKMERDENNMFFI